MTSPSVPGGSPILALAGVDTYYGDSHILQGVTLEVESAAITCLLGRNGAGKTTAVRTVMGFTPPRTGRIALRGRDITGAPPHRVARAGVALVPQGRGIFPDLTVRQQLTLAPRPGRWSLGRVDEGIGYYKRFKEHNVQFDMIVSHGNAVGLYFRDPEGNRCEVYWPTGLKARQPYLEMVNLDEDPEEIMRKIRESVAEHGKEGVVDMRALQMQDIGTPGL